MAYSNYRSVLATLGCLLMAPVAAAELAEIDVSGFRDIAKHWNDKYGRDRSDQIYTPQQFIPIADNVVKFQVADGGWPKSLNPLLNVPELELRSLLGRSVERSTFDNRTTYTHIDYLARVYLATGLQRFRTAAERGLDYVFREQRESGGWRGADVDAVTYNDDVMIGVMRLLSSIDREATHFDWLDKGRRAKATAALKRSIDVTLRCQIEVNGVKTGWCQQHSHATFEPVKARTYELPAICPVETAEVVRFIMKIDEPTPRIINAIEAAVSWMNRTKLTGIRVQNVTIDPVRFENHTATRDRIVVADPGAPPIWARYYEIATNRPFFCNRDGTTVYTLAEVHPERRTGYGWYSRAPTHLIEVEYPRWKAKLTSTSTSAVE